MPIFIDENIRTETKYVAHLTPAAITMLENDLVDCPNITNSCSGGPDCPVKRFSLLKNGRPGKPHWAGANENIVVQRYNLTFTGKTGALYKATRVGCCNLQTLELGSGGTNGPPKGDVEEAMGELIEVLILFGGYMKNFKAVWSLTTDMTNKKACNEFFSFVEDSDWITLIAFLDTQDFRKTIPKIRGENRIDFDQRLKVKQLMSLEYVKTLIRKAYANQELTPWEYDVVMQVFHETKERVNNKGRRGETAFPPLRATREQINFFLGVENDPINLTQGFINKSLAAADSGSMSLGTITIGDDRHDLSTASDYDSDSA